MKALLCTTNKNKIREFQEKINLFHFHTYSDESIDIDIEETGNTFKENADIKLQTILDQYEYLKEKYQLIIAEDSGLCVESLEGAPGVYSARYSGEKSSDDSNNKKLLEELEKSSNRNAHYEACIACYFNNKKFYFTGKVEGSISNIEIGNNGFGYDPLFIPNGYSETFGQLDEKIKLQISHRTMAINKMIATLNLDNL